MTAGRLVVLALLAAAALAGGGAWYLQLYAYYERLPEQARFALTAPGAATPQDFAIRDFRGIDSDSSPIRYRACFTLAGPVGELAVYPDPTPLIAPGWFDCFDASAIGAALAEGRAQAVLSQANIRYGIDRVVALFPDGRGYAWNQINACGRAHFDGNPVPPGCPPPPAR